MINWPDINLPPLNLWSWPIYGLRLREYTDEYWQRFFEEYGKEDTEEKRRS